MKRTLLTALVVPFIVSGCLMVPGPRGTVSIVPILPPLVVLGPEPYYVQGDYYYYYRNNVWYYSRSRGGPWVDLPRDRYPGEVRFENDGAEKGGARNPGRP